MDSLSILEQKVLGLIQVVKDIKARNEHLEKEKDVISVENSELKKQLDDLTQQLDNLKQQQEAIELNALKNNDDLDELNQEKALTKMALDDLIESLKSIDSLVEEQQP